MILVNFGSDNGLVPDGTKPFAEPMLTYLQWDSKNAKGNITVYFLSKGSYYLSSTRLWKIMLLKMYSKSLRNSLVYFLRKGCYYQSWTGLMNYASKNGK